MGLKVKVVGHMPRLHAKKRSCPKVVVQGHRSRSRSKLQVKVTRSKLSGRVSVPYRLAVGLTHRHFLIKSLQRFHYVKILEFYIQIFIGTQCSN